MNDIPPIALPPAAPESRTSPLAIWSLVLGILSLTCFSIFAAIPAVICGHMALTRIKRSGGIYTGGGLATGYTGLAISLFFIPLMMAIAIPNFVRARDTSMANACINNLRVIDAAKQQWALENNKQGNNVPNQNDLLPYLKNQQFPVCPAGGSYTINCITNLPTCSIPKHVLPVLTN